MRELSTLLSTLINNFGIILSTFSDRLREEPKRLRLNQTGLGSLAGVQKGAQVNYEAGERAPNADYLAAIAAAGADVLYILTGQRSQPVATTAKLSSRVRALVANYEATDEAGKKIIEGTASLAAQPKAAAAGRQ